MRLISRPLILFASIVLAVAGSLPVSAPAETGRQATLSPAVSAWLASAAETSTLQAIVTFDDRASVDRIDELGVGAVKLSKLPMAFATLTAAQVQTVASWTEVRSVWHDQQNTIYLDESVGLTKADQVWAGTGLRTPYTGAGVGVAVIDTGCDATHPDLPAGTKVRGYAVVGNPFAQEPMTFVPATTGDTYGHGTHVASTVGGLGTASGGRYKGMAPGCTIYSFKTDAGAFLLDSWALASFDWILAHPEENIRVSSNSWGSGDGTDYEPDDPINVATKILYDAGVTVLFAASNSGGPDTLNQYATSPWVVSVAAGTKDLGLADFSSRGRLGDNWDRKAAQRNNTGIYRPTITAPGADINAAKSSQAVVMASGTDPENPFYTYASGTSMATPHVAGAVALMLEARPLLEPQHVIDILEGTAFNLPQYEIWEVGMGHLDALAATQAAEKGKIHFPPAINGRTPQYSLTGSTPYSGTVLTSTWLVRECPDTTGLLNHHEFEVAPGTDVIYAELEWDDPTQLVYLVLYDPSCQEAAVSAGLLDIGSVNHRALAVSSPAPGTWKVAVYGRINLPTAYRGAFSTYDER